MNQRGEIIIYQTGSGKTDIKIRLDKKTLWLDQYQMTELFETDRTSIGRHIRNIYQSSELKESSTCAKITQVQKEGNRTVQRQIKAYNMDVIISVGYRVNSKKGTQFRIWATNVLRQHLIKGYSVHKQRLKELQQAIQLINRTAQNQRPDDQTSGLFSVLSDYVNALDILDDYDHQRLKIPETTSKIHYSITYNEAKEAIRKLKEKFGGSALFGKEKDKSFNSSISTINQTFEGKDLYPSVEEKAAHLLYFVVKNHSFTDGNKRIGAWLFIWYLDKNKLLYAEYGTKRIADSTLVALTLMIAESKPEEKEMMVKVVVNLINSQN